MELTLPYFWHLSDIATVNPNLAETLGSEFGIDGVNIQISADFIKGRPALIGRLPENSYPEVPDEVEINEYSTNDFERIYFDKLNMYFEHPPTTQELAMCKTFCRMLHYSFTNALKDRLFAHVVEQNLLEAANSLIEEYDYEGDNCEEEIQEYRMFMNRMVVHGENK